MLTQLGHFDRQLLENIAFSAPPEAREILRRTGLSPRIPTARQVGRTTGVEPDADERLQRAYEAGFAAAVRGEEAAPGCTATPEGHAFLRGYVDGRASLSGRAGPGT
jgi:hypothetical protein